MTDQILDSVLLPLADLYESGKSYWQPIQPTSAEEFEPLRECLAQLRAEGLITEPFAGAKAYRLTPKGYAKFSDKIRTLRELSRVFPSLVKQ